MPPGEHLQSAFIPPQHTTDADKLRCHCFPADSNGLSMRRHCYVFCDNKQLGTSEKKGGHVSTGRRFPSFLLYFFLFSIGHGRRKFQAFKSRDVGDGSKLSVALSTWSSHLTWAPQMQVFSKILKMY